MAKVTYLGDEETPGPVTWAGHFMEPGQPVDVTNPIVLAKAAVHPMFDVEFGDMPADTPRDRGAKAAAAGKKRSVPPAYRGKSEAEDWLEGYDGRFSS